MSFSDSTSEVCSCFLDETTRSRRQTWIQEVLFSDGSSVESLEEIPRWVVSVIQCSRCSDHLLRRIARSNHSLMIATFVIQALQAAESPELVGQLLFFSVTYQTIHRHVDRCTDFILEACRHNNLFVANTALLALSGARPFSEIIRQRRMLERAIATGNAPAVNWFLWHNIDTTTAYPMTDGSLCYDCRNAMILSLEMYAFAVASVRLGLNPSASPGGCPFTVEDAYRVVWTLLNHPKTKSRSLAVQTKEMFSMMERQLIAACQRPASAKPCARDAVQPVTNGLLERIEKFHRLLVVTLTLIGYHIPDEMFVIPFVSTRLAQTEAFARFFHSTTRHWKLYKHLLDSRDNTVLHDQGPDVLSRQQEQRDNSRLLAMYQTSISTVNQSALLCSPMTSDSGTASTLAAVMNSSEVYQKWISVIFPGTQPVLVKRDENTAESESNATSSSLEDGVKNLSIF